MFSQPRWKISFSILMLSYLTCINTFCFSADLSLSLFPGLNHARNKKTHGWWLARVVWAASIRSVSFPSDCIPHLHPSPSYSGCSKRHEQTEWREREQGDNVFMDICFSEALQEAADRSSCLWLDLSSLGMAAVKNTKKIKKSDFVSNTLGCQRFTMHTSSLIKRRQINKYSLASVWPKLQLCLFILLRSFLSLFVY